MRTIILSLAVVLATLLFACRPSSQAGGEQGDAQARVGHAVTLWSEQTELFVEFPTLVVGHESAFAAHLTRISDFRPVDEGRVVVLLSGGGYPDERFETSEALVPGIFRPVAEPEHSGSRNLSLSLESEAVTDLHDLGMVTVFPDLNAALAEVHDEEEESEISFLKEQQWSLDFASERVSERTLRPSLSVSGSVRARSSGEVHVTAPVAGRLLTAGGAFPSIGMDVERDQILVSLAPRLDGQADVATLELAVARAQLDVEHTVKELERLEGLLAEGAVQERRVVAARRDEGRAQAELTAAQRRLQQYGRIQLAASSGSAGGITVRAPISGTLVAVGVAPGMFLEEGREMFHIVDLDQLWLEVRVPEASVGSSEKASGAWFEVGGFSEPFLVDSDRVVSTGGVVDERTRTVPVIFEIDNPSRSLRVGMFARAHLLTGAPVTGVAIPTEAVIEDGGQSVAFVHVGGESLERRVVSLGVREGGLVEVIDGIRSGERVVTRGAFMVKLAASATEAPAHGHGH